MSFFKKLGKSIGKGFGGIVKSATKMISVGTLRNAISGDFSAIAKEATGRLKDTVKSVGNEIVQSNIPHRTGGAKPSMPAQVLDLPQANAALNRNGGGVNIGDILESAAGGALVGAGNTLLSNDSKAQQITASSAENVFLAWLKQRWYIVVGAILLFVLAVKYIKPKTSKRGRYAY